MSGRKPWFGPLINDNKECRPVATGWADGPEACQCFLCEELPGAEVLTDSSETLGRLVRIAPYLCDPHLNKLKGVNCGPRVTNARL